MYKCISLDEFRNRWSTDWQEVSILAMDASAAAIEYVVDHHDPVVELASRAPRWSLMVLVLDTINRTVELVKVTAPPVPVYTAETVDQETALYYHRIDLTEVSP